MEVTEAGLGAQVADLVCFSAVDYKERFSQAKTRIQNWKVRISVGDVLVSNRNNIMFAIVKVGPRNTCQENLATDLILVRHPSSFL